MTDAAKIISTERGVFAPQQTPPTFEDSDAEKKLLGRILSQSLTKRGNDEYARVERLTVTDFSERKHGLIWHAMRQIVDDDQSISITSVENRLKAGVIAGGALAIDHVGGDYLKSLLLHKDGDVVACMERIAELSLVRHGERVIADLRKTLLSPNTKVSARADKMLSQITDYMLRVQTLSGTHNQSLPDTMAEHQSLVDERRAALSAGDMQMFGVTSCLKGLQDIITGYKRRKLYLATARPGGGKTALALNEAIAALNQGLRVVFITLEMDEIELVDRIVSIISGIPLESLETGNLSEDEVVLLNEFYSRIASSQTAKHFTFLSFDPTKGAPKMSQIEARLREHMVLVGADIVFFDQVSAEMISPETPRLPTLEMMSQAVGTLKRWAKAFNVPIVAMAQLNRETDRNANAEPTLANLASSSSLEKTADVVMALYTPPDADTGADFYPIDVLVLKQRQGRKGRTRALYVGSTTTFSDWTGK